MERIKESRADQEALRAFLREYIPGHHEYEVVEEARRRGWEITTKRVRYFKVNHGIRSGFPKGRRGRMTGTPLWPKEVQDYILATKRPGIGAVRMTWAVNQRFGTDYTEEQVSTYLNSRVYKKKEKSHA